MSEAEESIPPFYKSDEMTRLELPAETMEVFEEVQPFDQIWLWILMGITTVATVISIFLSGLSIPILITMSFAILFPLALMASLKLRTRIDSDGIHYRMVPFHMKEQIIPWNEIDQVYVRRYSPISEYGGWGIRFGPQGRAFNVKGSDGIQVIKKDGKRILIGTQLPEEAGRYLSHHMITV